MKSEYHGIYAALVTPYTSEGKVDYRELQKLVDYLICQGLEGFYVNGSTAEAFLLSEEERNSTIRAVVEANSGRAKVICHVGAISTEQAISFAKNAEKCGMDADRIVIMNEGKIDDVGTHAELMQRSEIYREVYYSQQKGVEE